MTKSIRNGDSRRALIALVSATQIQSDAERRRQIRSARRRLLAAARGLERASDREFVAFVQATNSLLTFFTARADEWGTDTESGLWARQHGAFVYGLLYITGLRRVDDAVFGEHTARATELIEFLRTGEVPGRAGLPDLVDLFDAVEPAWFSSSPKLTIPDARLAIYAAVFLDADDETLAGLCAQSREEPPC